MLANILAVGLMGTAMALSPMQPRYVVDNQNDTLTFSAEELNNNTYQYLNNKLQVLGSTPTTSIQNATITYNSNTYTFDDLAEGRLSYYNTANDYTIYFIVNNDIYENPIAKWYYFNSVEDKPFTASMTINNAEWFIANIEEPPSLTLSKYDLNNKKYTYLAEQINSLDNLPSEITNATITYNGNTYEYTENVDKIIRYTDYYGNEITFTYETNDNNYGKWQYYDELIEQDVIPFTASMTINNAQWFIQNINAPLDSGDMMTAITSGLPLMANLAQAFLNGFTSIFWNSTTNTLTTFSNFALIMLSVAIVFACIKLVLNVVRSNTGV